MASSAIHVGAWEYRGGKYQPIEKEGKVVAAKIMFIEVDDNHDTGVYCY